MANLKPSVFLTRHDGGRYHIETSDWPSKSMNWFLYDNGVRHERINVTSIVTVLQGTISSKVMA